MLELYHHFFIEFCDVKNFENFEMVTDSLYLVLAEKELEYCIRTEKKAEWEHLRSMTCTDSLTADAGEFFSRKVLGQAQKHDKIVPGLLKEGFRCNEMLCLCSKIYCCSDFTAKKLG